MLRKIFTSKFRIEFCVKYSYSTFCNVPNNLPEVSSPEFKIVFLGNDNFSVQSLKAITDVIHSKDSLKVVISNSHNIVGKYAEDNQLHTVLWNDFKSQEHSDSFHVGVVASFGYLIPKRVIERCQLGILNVHGSLLPKYRGAAPISRAIANGDTETGISIMKIAPHRFDIGPILSRKKCPIHPDIREPELNKLMTHLGSQTLKDILLHLKDSINHVEEQTNEEATFAPKITREMSQVDWNNLSALQIYNLFRGVSCFFKLNTFYNDKKVDLDNIGLVRKSNTKNQIHETINKDRKVPSYDVNTDFSQFYPSPVSHYVSLTDSIWNSKFLPGQIIVKDELVFVKCADEDGWIFCQKVKVVGTKWMTARDFKNGFLSKTKSTPFFHFSPQSNEKASILKSVG